MVGERIYHLHGGELPVQEIVKKERKRLPVFDGRWTEKFAFMYLPGFSTVWCTADIPSVDLSLGERTINGAAMSRDIGELSESDEGEPDFRREEPDLRREEPNELASLWSGPVTRSRLRAQEKSLQHLAKSVGLKSEEENQDKPACWFNFISV
ncbi:hypothetical protein F2Q69_00022945 [Brassica cretica]|uniref:Uncharacterized protein n=1 Tax=Brassica cretica TaxID=69181 RepID=A0A8S9Q9X6_BRACR|nr:hypothetical protein F2Q69_00022945 [Brassica cretica]